MNIINFSKCPRCGEYAFEYLKTYGHCVNCLYHSEEDVRLIPLGKVIRDLNKMQADRKEQECLQLEDERKCA